MKILLAKLNDCSEILALQKLAYRQEAEIYNDFSIPPLHQTMEEIEQEFALQIFIKAVIDQKIVGSIRAYEADHICYIGKVIVHPEYQDRGIGSKMMHKIESLFPSVKRFELFTGENSNKNLHFYQKLGYTLFKKEKLSDKVSLVYLEKANRT